MSLKTEMDGRSNMPRIEILKIPSIQGQQAKIEHECNKIEKQKVPHCLSSS
jgi:hypothetical protein